MKHDIQNFRQNHPELVVRDLEPYVEAPITREVLKYRGVNKWLRVRRLLIQLKSRWLVEIKEFEVLQEKAKFCGNIARYHELKGAKAQLVACRQQIRALCHSSRDVDFPTTPKEFGAICELPFDFPRQPSKRWLLHRDNDRT